MTKFRAKILPWCLVIGLGLSALGGCRETVNNVADTGETTTGSSRAKTQVVARDLAFLALANVEAIVYLDGNNNMLGFYEIGIEKKASANQAPERLALDGTPGSNSPFVVAGGRKLSLPQGFVTVSGFQQAGVPGKVPTGDTKPLGKGSQGTAFLVRETSTGKLWALKFDNKTLDGSLARTAEYLRNVAETFVIDDVAVADSMERGFANKLEARLLNTPEGIPVVVKTAVTGGTLKSVLERNLFFADNPTAAAMRSDLEAMFQRIAQGKHVYADLNPDNIAWSSDSKQWVVIDAKPPKLVETFSDALRGNLDSFVAKLPLNTSFAAYRGRRALFQLVNAGQYLPELDAKGFAQMQDFQGRLKGDVGILEGLQVDTGPLRPTYTYSEDPEVRNPTDVRVDEPTFRVPAGGIEPPRVNGGVEVRPTATLPTVRVRG